MKPRRRVGKKLFISKSSDADFGKTVQNVTVAQRKSSRSKNAKQRVINGKKREKNGLFEKLFFLLKLLFFGFLGFILFVFCMYFFVFPSIMNRAILPKNILIIFNTLDEQNSHIYFTHTDVVNRTKQSEIIKINNSQQVMVPGGYGEHPLRSVYGLLSQDKKDKQFINFVYSQLFKTSVDEVIVISDLNEKLSQVNLPTLVLNEFFNTVKNLDFSNLYTLLYLHYNTKNSEVKKLDNIESFAQYSATFKTISSTLSQECSIAVVNSTGKNGVAREHAELLENIGAIVVKVDDSKDLIQGTHIYLSESPNCGGLVSAISGIFSKKPELLPIETLENAQQYRANVIVVIGE